jgi:methylmalonyl-CoA mutase C-terminal domain/subunit
MAKKKIRILLAKPGLDGHDRGAKVIAHAMREAGMEVVYTGLHQTVPSIVNQAVQEDVDVIGLSIMSGAHIPICRKLMAMIRDQGLDDKLIVVGGVIPNKDIPLLKEIGVGGVFPGGASVRACSTIGPDFSPLLIRVTLARSRASGAFPCKALISAALSSFFSAAPAASPPEVNPKINNTISPVIYISLFILKSTSKYSRTAYPEISIPKYS